MRSRGTSLLEATLLVAILGMLAAGGAGAARRVQELAAVGAALEELVALFARARMVAVSGGGARVEFRGPPWRATLLSAAGDSLDGADVRATHGVEVELAATAGEVSVTYDALGLGRGVGRTITLHRGRATRTLVISGYGRVRRR